MSARDHLRRLIAEQTKMRYECPCNAEGEMVERAPGVFVLALTHEPWCPMVHDSRAN